jgi:hypothetical protein
MSCLAMLMRAAPPLPSRRVTDEFLLRGAMPFQR